MKNLKFTIEISAPKEEVWKALWHDAHYREWTSAFQEGSYFESTLEKGSDIKFLTPDQNGMYGVVEDNIPFVKMHFRHLGEVREGEKQEPTYGEEAIEHYDLTQTAGGTQLTATMNAPEEYIPYFAEVFPKALENVKSIAEKG